MPANEAFAGMREVREMGETVADATSAQMSQMIRGYWVSQIVGTMAVLGIADHLGEHPLAYEEIAKRIECDPRATYRLLRAAANIGIVSARPGGDFALTALGQTLRSKVAGSMRDTAVALTAPGHWLPWGR